MVPPLKKRVPGIKQGFLHIFLLVFILLSFAYAQPSNYVRVAILQNAKSLAIRVGGFYEVLDKDAKKALSKGRDLKTTIITYEGFILIGSDKFDSERVFISTQDKGEIIINGRKFRGDICLIRKGDAGLLVVNYIDLEDYIQGILYHEASHYWPMEALKAQAIVCRTYALYQMQENKFNDFDMTSDIYSQVYGGKTSERLRTNRAVKETKGQVLTYSGNIFPSYYHATCGGHTEDASLLWNIDIAPLKGVVCGFCKDSPYFNWHAVLNKDEIKDALAKGNYNIKEIKNIAVLDKDDSSRIINLIITTDKESLKIPAKDFRNLVGPNLIRSTNFTVNIVDNDAVFEGFGWGHGVGLCQWGAYFMAKQGYRYQEILKYYYTNAEISSLK
jgi:stage II sporulation protein D